ncbi:uncharacterized protein F4822DRAFT_445881 [Hypoxylon trugodes]|uniref:uncharacterized protein n=1 Tax=Hypoxylon trugodes TaxID=326681 RepID=UPI002198B75D|nr:uncharacterized protein F4822DRAFT_445881 [Hypoxylon trugodes]KAI1384434.1 hypothetical protein F4822DRAFT_445881 [Hypoxylon trugodes]
MCTVTKKDTPVSTSTAMSMSVQPYPAHNIVPAQNNIWWFSIRLLDLLWSLLFGVTTGPSPWKDFLPGLHDHTSNGSADSMIDLTSFNTTLNSSPVKAEEYLRQEIGKHFPMKISLPKTVTPTLESKSSSHPVGTTNGVYTPYYHQNYQDDLQPLIGENPALSSVPNPAQTAFIAR